MDMRLAENLNQLRLNKSGITSDLSRVDAIPDPILIIGLGGTGVTALSKVKNAVYRRFNLPRDNVTGYYKDKPDNIEYLGLDTADGIICDDDKDSGRSIELNTSTEFLRMYTPAVPKMLANWAILPPTITEWLSPNLSPNDFDKGANGIRQMGRLSLFLRITDVVNMIERKLKSVLQGKTGNLYVFILSGVSGGTGSGTFIDIPYIVRCVAEQLGVSNRLKTIGYLFLPDVNLNDTKDDYIQSNGFAALKELDYWMTDHGQPFVQEYTKNYVHNSVAAPYNYCYLISSIDKNNVLLTNPKSTCMEIVSENLVHFISKGKVQNTTFTLPAFLSNLDQYKLSIYSGAKPPFQANYEYFILGASSYEIPIEKMMNYAAYILMERIKVIYDNEPGAGDIRAFIEKLGLGHEDLMDYFTDSLSFLAGWQQNPYYSVDNAGKIDLDGQLNHEMRAFLDRLHDNRYKNNVKTSTKDLKKRIRKELDQLFINPEKGPLFVNRLIFSPVGNCMLRSLDKLIEDAEKQQKDLEIERQTKKDTAAFLLPKTRASLLNFGRKTNWEKYIHTKIDEYKAALKVKVIRDILLPLYEELAFEFRQINTGIYEVWVDILKQLKDVFKDNAGIVSELKITKHANVQVSTWSILEPQDWMKEIGEMLNEKSREQILYTTQEFLTELQKNTVFWIDNQGKEAVRLMSNFVSNRFSEVARKSLETYLQDKYGNMTFDDIVSQNIGPKLNSCSAPIFDMDSTVIASLNDFPSHFTVSIPENCEKLNLAFVNYVKKADVKGSPEQQVASSEIKHSIYWVNTSIGVPLYAYSRLRTLETIYEYRAPNDPGIHLRDDWRAFPSPFPDKADPVHRMDRSREKRELFRRALEMGMIVEDSEVKPRFKIKKLPPVTVENRRGILDRPEQLIPIFQSIDLESAEDNFLRVPHYSNIVKRQIQEIEQVDQTIKDREDIERQENLKRERLNELILALVSGTLYWAGPKLVYQNDPDAEVWSPLVDKLEHEDFYLVAFDTYRRKNERQIQKFISTDKAKRDHMEAGVIKKRLMELKEEFAGIKAHFDHRKLDGKAVDEKYVAFLTDTLDRVNFMTNVY